MSRSGSNFEGNNTTSKTNKKTHIFFKIVFALYIAISLIFFVYVVSVNMLPIKYLVLLAVVDIVITGLVSIGILKRHKKKALNIVCTVIAILIVVIYGFVYNYLGSTMNFIGTMSENLEQTEDYYIVTLDNGKFNAIEDIDGKNLHVFSVGQEYEDVKNDISAKVNVTFKEDESLIGLAQDILDWKSYVALISASQYEMIKDELSDFETKTKIIYTVTHKITASQEEIIDKNSEYKISDGSFNIYISGIDTSGYITNVSRSDANMIATVNTKTHEILLTSIPRDYYVTLHTYKAKDKLTHTGVYGINETISTVEDLFDVDINYYVRVNFTTLIKLVDTLGGIDVESDYTFSAQGYSFVKGTNHMDGSKALAFSRERHSFADGDNQRVKNQQKVLEAIMKKCLNSSTILTKYTSILSSMSGSFQTNIEQSDISNLVKGQLDDMSTWKITMNSVTGISSMATTYSGGSQLLSVMIPDDSSVTEAKTKIETILNNK